MTSRMSKFLGVWGGGPPGHYLDATPVEVKSGQNLVFPLKNVVFPYAESGVWTSTGVANSLVSGGAPTPHSPRNTCF